MDKNKEKKEEIEVKQDSLMWNDDDYEAVQKMTGFDDESVLEDQKKGLNIVIFVAICIICLVIGIVIGYSINKREPNEPTVYADEPKVITPTIKSAYTRLNESNELYLYVLSSVNEEISILQLNDRKYYYEIVGTDLYVLIDNDGLNLYKYSFDKQGYHRELELSLTDRYKEFYYKNGYILIQRDNYVRMYNKAGVLYEEIDLNLTNVLDYNDSYIVYSSNEGLSVYNLKTDESKVISEENYHYYLLENNQFYYLENDKLNNYNILEDSITELTKVEANTFFIKVKDYYLYNDGNILYIFDYSMRKLKEFGFTIGEIAYLDQENLILIPADYDTQDCALKENEYYIFNIYMKTITSQKITGCLKTRVLNDLLRVN